MISLADTDFVVNMYIQLLYIYPKKPDKASLAGKDSKTVLTCF